MSDSEKDKLSDKIRSFKQSIQGKAGGLGQHGFFSQLTFRWVWRYIYFASRETVDYEMMPNLSPNYQHANYSSKMLDAFRRTIGELRSGCKPNGKYFIPRLTWTCFKWEMAWVFLLLFVVKAFEYSTSYFINSILKIKDTYKPEEYKWAFISLCGLMLLTKLFNSLLNEGVTYFVVL